MDLEWQIDLLRRQYLQLVEPEQLTLPAIETLKSPDVQAKIFERLFNVGNLSFPPPDRYRFRVLKRIVRALEQSINDPDEDEISDDMTDSLAKLFAQALVPANLAAQQKSYVTYTAPFSALGAPEVTLLEARSLLASSGTTGLRTWEAALLLGKYLMSSDGRKFVQNSNVLELGAGTGFLSIICAKHLNAQQVLATDGNRGVIDGLELNADINGLELRGVINPVVFKWGHSLIDVLDVRQESRSIDLVLGADVTYDNHSIPSLVSTLRDLFHRYPDLKALISATVRNEKTLNLFMDACKQNMVLLERLDLNALRLEDQTGYFVPTSTPIHVYLITGFKEVEGPLRTSNIDLDSAILSTAIRTKKIQ